jgi:hypothetical protein
MPAGPAKASTAAFDDWESVRSIAIALRGTIWQAFCVPLC